MCVFESSSTANTIPPRGVLKAAASPAAAPVMIMFFLEIFGHQWGRYSLTFRKTEPAIWIVGPSLPIAPPPIIKAKLDKTLNTIIFILNKCRILVCSFGFAISTAAITCGIPLPFP